ncbi:MAG TPA: pitrilysin family protein [Planctomycetota bacterium]|nr:pitrilysin family protein [Planctomycetota bacterium]
MKLLTLPLCLILLCFAAFSADEEFSEFTKKIESFVLPNGLTIILYPRGDAPVISCVTYVKAGSTDEHVGITGIAHQLEHLAFKGTPYVGTKDYEAEKAALSEIDKLYGTIQELEQKVPADMRDGFLTLLAQVTSTGSARGKDVQHAQQIMIKQAKDLMDSWKKAGVTLSEADQKKLTDLVVTYAAKVQDAEKYVEQNQYSNLIDRAGGTGLNAFTSDDRTVFHVSLPANRLELWASLESDRFMNTVPRQLEKEKQVVLEERRMRTDSSPFGKLYESFLGVAFQAHPYGTAVIGNRSDILEYSRPKIGEFYRTHYVPGETIVAVVGDIDVPAAKKLLTDYFGRIPAAPNPGPLVTVEPAQEGERRLEVEFPANPLLLLGYHVPERNHPDTPALVMLSEIATSGRTSRLETDLVKTKKANSVGSWLGPGERYPRLIFFDAEVAAQQNPNADPQEVYTQQLKALNDLEANLFVEIEKLKTETPTPEEMKRVITRYRSAVLREMKSNLSLAQELADYQAIAGDWHALFREIQQISAVTPEQVTAMAKKYLTKENRTVGRVVPVPVTEGKHAGL